jgi:hypothetical protein
MPEGPVCCRALTGQFSARQSEAGGDPDIRPPSISHLPTWRSVFLVLNKPSECQATLDSPDKIKGA